MDVDSINDTSSGDLLITNENIWKIPVIIDEQTDCPVISKNISKFPVVADSKNDESVALGQNISKVPDVVDVMNGSTVISKNMSKVPAIVNTNSRIYIVDSLSQIEKILNNPVDDSLSHSSSVEISESVGLSGAYLI